MRELDWVDDIPAGVVVLGDGGIVAANQAATQILIGPGAVSALPCLEACVVATQRDTVAATLAAALAGRPPEADVVAQLDRDPSRFVVLALGPCRDGRIVATVNDITEFFHVMLLLAYSANTTMVIDESAQILWGPVGRYAAQELDSPWYGRGEANPLGWIHPEDIGRVLEALGHVLANPGIMYELTVRTRHVVLEDQWGTATIRAINLLDEPLVRGVLVQTQAEGYEQKVQLGRTTGSFHSIAEAAPIGIILSDHLGRSLYWNDAARRLFDLGPTDRSEGATVEDVDWTSCADPDHRVALRTLLDEALLGARDSLTARFDLPGSRVRWLSVTVAPQENDMGEPMGWLATLQDLTHEVAVQQQLEATQEQLLHLATHDPLTGLPNRRLLSEQLTRALARMGRDRQGVALLFCDLDGFKPVNDAQGHDIGDQVLAVMAERLTEASRGNDLAVRLGGDEFVILVEGFTSPDELEVIARRLIARAHEPIALPEAEDGDPVQVGVSIGIAVAGPADTPDSLLSRADDLMYRAKADGKGRYVLEPGAGGLPEGSAGGVG